MINPFDQNFFRFLLGFTFILITSFTILFFVARYGIALNQETASIIDSIVKDRENRDSLIYED